MGAGAGRPVPDGQRSAAGSPPQALHFTGEALWALDQTRLPQQELELELRTPEEVTDAIRRLAIRGAPLIGVAAAYGLALGLRRDPAGLERDAELLAGARPTAVNLAWAVGRVKAAAGPLPAEDRAAAARREAEAIHAEEEQASASMAAHGAELLAGARRVLTHCNTGALAAPGAGTALGVIAELARRGSLESVLATETRPLLQGARLTVYELQRLGIAHELIVDSAAAGLIAAGEVDAVVVGCDRVTAAGDVANKVGTYGLALAAAAAGIEFVVAGPTSTIDSHCADAAAIVVEQRAEEEVRSLGGNELSPPGTRCRNPAFDVTPAPLVRALVTERGVARPVNRETVAALLRR
jgi:S-methyl-5-thioribose-1-phosphate isomerase